MVLLSKTCGASAIGAQRPVRREEAPCAATAKTLQYWLVCPSALVKAQHGAWQIGACPLRRMQQRICVLKRRIRLDVSLVAGKSRRHMTIKTI